MSWGVVQRMMEFVETYSQEVYSTFASHYLLRFMYTEELFRVVAVNVSKKTGIPPENIRLFDKLLSWHLDKIFRVEDHEIYARDEDVHGKNGNIWNPDRSKLQKLILYNERMLPYAVALLEKAERQKVC